MAADNPLSWLDLGSWPWAFSFEGSIKFEEQALPARESSLISLSLIALAAQHFHSQTCLLSASVDKPGPCKALGPMQDLGVSFCRGPPKQSCLCPFQFTTFFVATADYSQLKARKSVRTDFRFSWLAGDRV